MELLGGCIPPAAISVKSARVPTTLYRSTVFLSKGYVQRPRPLGRLHAIINLSNVAGIHSTRVHNHLHTS